MTKSTYTGASILSQSSQSSSQTQITWASALEVGASVSTAVGSTIAMSVSTKRG